MQQRQRFLFSVTELRAVMETFCVGGIIWMLVSLGYRLLLARSVPITPFLLAIGALSVPWTAVRLRRYGNDWWLRRLREVGVVGAICVVQSILATIYNVFDSGYAFSEGRSLPALLDQPILLVLQMVALILMFLVINYCVFLLIRLIARGLDAWNRLRRTHLQWSLTHAHALVVLLGTLLLMILADLILGFFAREAFLRYVIPIFAFVGTLGLLSALAVIPPSALFSYFVVRPTVNRLHLLTAGTSALRAGNYKVRVPVTGEDEVAQLQTDFNAMASNLEHVMSELQQERDTVGALLQNRRELVANASHELRTPVATLRSSLESTIMHWGERSEAQVRQDLSQMEGEVLHLQTLVEDLFSLARADVGRLSLRCEPTDMGPLVKRIVEARAPLAWQASRIEVVCTVSEALPLALVDATRVEQILQNLLHNAVRHTGPGGIVAVVLGVDRGMISLQVKDTGEGIASEKLSKIWSSFHQPDAVQPGAGLGLGLALVKEWSEAMGGSVAVESVLGEGTCITVSLPALVESVAPSTS